MSLMTPVIFQRFQYMLLLRGATDTDVDSPEIEHVSIHAPLARSNAAPPGRTAAPARFNTCSSCEEQLSHGARFAAPVVFQYMLLLRGATCIHSMSPSN